MNINPIRATIAGVMVVSTAAMLFLGMTVPDFWIGFTGMAVAFYLAGN